jgi:hypothetical protein
MSYLALIAEMGSLNYQYDQNQIKRKHAKRSAWHAFC